MSNWGMYGKVESARRVGENIRLTPGHVPFRVEYGPEGSKFVNDYETEILFVVRVECLNYPQFHPDWSKSVPLPRFRYWVPRIYDGTQEEALQILRDPGTWLRAMRAGLYPDGGISPGGFTIEEAQADWPLYPLSADGSFVGEIRLVPEGMRPSMPSVKYQAVEQDEWASFWSSLRPQKGEWRNG